MSGGKEFVLWGTKGGVEDVIRVNGKETQNSLVKVKKMKSILEKRGDFKNIRIQIIDMNKPESVTSDFIKSINFWRI